MTAKKVCLTIRPLQDKRISSENENKFIKKWKRGDERIRGEIVKRYFPYIASIAKKYHGFFPWIEFVELVEEGNFGLLQALDHYDYKRDVRFTSYAWFWITKCMQEYITQHIVVLKIPVRVIRNLRKIEKQIENEIKAKNNVSLEDIEKKIDLGLDEIKSLISERNVLMTPLSLDRTFNDNDEHQTLKDYISGEDLPSEEILEKDEDRQKIKDFLYMLSRDESEVLQWRFGFKDNKYHTLKEIASKLKVHAQRIKDLEMKALLKLKSYLSGDEQDISSR